MGSRYGGLKQIDGFWPSNECIIEYSIFDAIQAGFSEVVCIIRKDIEEDFRQKIGNKIESMIPVKYVFQEQNNLPDGYILTQDRIKPWGTGHAVWCAKDVLKNNFACISADDFYGPIAFQKMATFLRTAKTTDNTYALVAYDLGNTLSEHGSVSRGICTLRKDGYLEKLIEHTNIVRGDNGPYHTCADGRIIALQETTPASMSFFGFTPHFFERLEREFCAFLDQHIDEPKFEFYLPQAVHRAMIKDGASVYVIQSEDSWYGVTNFDDKAICKDAIQEMVDENTYPENLWKETN